MSVDEGYIISNKYRRAIFDELTSGESNIDRISKKHRIFKKIAYKVVEDFVNVGIVEKKNNRYFLNEEGKKLSEKI